MNTGYVCGNNSTCLKTTNGGINWTIIFNGVNDPNYNSIYFIDNNTGYIAGDEYNFFGIILKTTNGGINWSYQISNTTNNLNSIFVIPQTNGNIAYAVGMNGSMVKTTNGGINWYLLTSGTFYHLFSIYFTDSNTGYAVGLGRILLKTTNGGIDWTIYPMGALDINFFSITFVNNNTGYISSTGLGGGPENSYCTTNSGANWNIQPGGGGYSICFPLSNTGFSVGRVGYISKTNNSGSNWFGQVSGTTKDLHSVFFINQNTGWAIGDSGIILKTTNSGEPIGIRPISSDIPKDFSLSQNYSNPFNPSTTIEFALPKSSDVKIVVYDISGRKVDVLVNEKLQAGSYRVDFNGSKLSSGVYFYKLMTDEFTQTKKMVLVK